MKKVILTVMALAVFCFAGCSSAQKTEATSVETTEEKSTEPVTQEQSTEETTEPKSKTNDTNVIASDDIYSFQIVINDELYQFPMTCADFMALGWEYDPGSYSDSLELAPNQYSTTETFKKDGLEIYGIVANFGINTVSIEDCVIGGIEIDQYQFDDSDTATVVLPGGITRSISTKEDIIAAYGEPSDQYESDLYTKMQYTLDYHQEVILYVTKETGTLGNIEVENLIPVENMDEGTENVSGEIPEAVLKYEAPASLEGKLEDFIFEYDGALYRLPVPVSEFVKNGWEIIEEDKDIIVKGKNSSWVTIMKDNQQFKTIVDNFDDNATAISNCFVTSIKTSEFGPTVSMKLPNGIESGMSQAEFEKIISGISNVEKEDGNTFCGYTIPLLDSKTESVYISVNKEKKEVSQIELDHSYYAEKDYMNR